MPALSVILPNYNHAAFLDRAITAFLEQSFRDFELIVVDDASTDNSVEVIEKYARADPRVVLHRNAENRGVIFSLNRALSLATADWVMGASADDYILPGYFASAFDLLAKHPEAGVCVGLCNAVDEDGVYQRTTPELWSSEPEYIPPAELAARIGGCGVPGPVIWNRQAFLDAGGYVPELRWHGDWFALQVVAFRRGVCFLPFPTSVVREAADSYSAGQIRSAEQRVVLRHLLRLLGDPRYADVAPYFRDSRLLGQFGGELVRAAVTDPHLPPAVPGILRSFAFAWAERVFRASVVPEAVGMARLLAGYGRAAVALLPVLDTLPTGSSPAVVAAVAEARQVIWRSQPLPTRLVKGFRNALGRLFWRLDQSTRPLHHARLENIETLLRQIRDMAAGIQAAMAADVTPGRPVRKPQPPSTQENRECLAESVSSSG